MGQSAVATGTDSISRLIASTYSIPSSRRLALRLLLASLSGLILPVARAARVVATSYVELPTRATAQAQTDAPAGREVIPVEDTVRGTRCSAFKAYGRDPGITCPDGQRHQAALGCSTPVGCVVGVDGRVALRVTPTRQGRYNIRMR